MHQAGTRARGQLLITINAMVVNRPRRIRPGWTGWYGHKHKHKHKHFNFPFVFLFVYIILIALFFVDLKQSAKIENKINK